jgi:hypothetical protein
MARGKCRALMVPDHVETDRARSQPARLARMRWMQPGSQPAAPIFRAQKRPYSWGCFSSSFQ